MRLSSDLPLAVELRDPEVRQHTLESQIRIGVPFQLRAMREKRGWTQEVVAEKLGTTQNTISRLENPKTGKPTIKTLLRIARVFDVGLLVRFVPLGFYGDVIEAMDSTHIEVPSYDEELAKEGGMLPKTVQRESRIPAMVQSESARDPNPPEPFAEIRPKERLLSMPARTVGIVGCLGGTMQQIELSQARG